MQNNYSSLKKTTYALIIVFSIIILIEIASSYIINSQIGLVLQNIKNNSTSIDEVINFDSFQNYLTIIAIPFYILSVILFVYWNNKAYKNIISFECANLKYSPAMAVGAYFIPILNLFMPYKIVCEIWKASVIYSDKVEIEDKSNWKKAPVSTIIYLWWFLFILNLYITRLVISSDATNLSNINELRNYLDLKLAANFINIAYFSISALLVYKLSKMQDLKRSLRNE